MASDRQRFEQAQSHWQELHDAGEYSLPFDVGRVALLVSFKLAKDDSEHESPDSFAREGYALADRFAEQGIGSEVIVDAVDTDIKTILQDPTFSSVYTIGHGSLSYLYIPNKDQAEDVHFDNDAAATNDYVDWYDVSTMTTHLKLGAFVQRQCGHYARRLSVPLGTFAVAEQRNVWAAAGRMFAPKSLDDPHNNHIKRIINHGRLSYDYVKQSFPHE